VKDIRERAVAMQSYARQAKDGQLIEDATDIRLRAERRAGPLLADMAGGGERRAQGGDQKSKSHDATLKLADIGVTKTQSSRWQRVGALDDEAFESRVAVAKKHAISSVEATAGERTTESGMSRSELLREMAERGERQTPVSARLVALRSLLRLLRVVRVPYCLQHLLERLALLLDFYGLPGLAPGAIKDHRDCH
jgi:hypothetical protein